MTEEQKEKYKKWKELVNMTPSELQKFLDSEDGKVAGLSRKEASDEGIRRGRDSAKAILRMKSKKVDDWNASDWEWCGRQISFISRMSGNKGSLRDKDGKPTRLLLSLKVWGNNPEKLNESLYENAFRILEKCRFI